MLPFNNSLETYSTAFNLLNARLNVSRRVTMTGRGASCIWHYLFWRGVCASVCVCACVWAAVSQAVVARWKSSSMEVKQQYVGKSVHYQHSACLGQASWDAADNIHTHSLPAGAFIHSWKKHTCTTHNTVAESLSFYTQAPTLLNVQWGAGTEAQISLVFERIKQQSWKDFKVK